MYAATPKKKRPETAVTYIRQLTQDKRDATGGLHFRILSEIKDRNGNQMVPKEKLADIARTALSDSMSIFNPEDISYDVALMVHN